MIGYVTLGTNHFEKAAAFYDKVLAVLGAKRTMEADSFIAWGTAPNEPMLSIILPYNKEAATAGNGTMVALYAQSPEVVKAVYEAALEAGGTDEGTPGPRSEGGDGFYAAYFRDLDGNKLNAFCMVPAS
ncbi:VOC family protein [Luteithermobacter gelatinilyticus]|uniref:VOC family protein n=1 Tax=Luteithermobacter gelatinilyticus TaxID=2582913 RepID=UPI0011061BE6|nr:VOC family protein [Luteithermobacter gelatinilyticus]